MNNMNFTCDVCGREILGCNIVNGMKFCAKCYQETFGGTKDYQHIEHKSQENAQNDIINELKQQLAITEKALEFACERVKYFEEMQDKEMGFYDLFGYENKYDLGAIIKQYKQQAKEMLENE